MATLLEQIQKKVESLGVGEISPLHSYLNTSSCTSNSAQVILSDPRIYKSLFCLDRLGIDKSLKSVVIEVKNSTLLIYYILDSSCFSIEYTCNYQTLEVIKELPTEIIHYLRILCSKKGRLEIIVIEDVLYLLFEDTYPSKMSAKERKEKEVDKYVLSVLLKEVDVLDKEVVELVKELTERKDSRPILREKCSLPVDLSSITINKEPIEYWCSVVNTEKGEFTIVDTSGFMTTLVICPVEVGKQLNKEAVEKQIEVYSLSEDELELLKDIMETTDDE